MRTLLMTTAAALAIAMPASAAQKSTIDKLADPGEVVKLSSWNMNDAYRDGMRTDALLDAEVRGRNGEEIGEVEDVIFDADGKIASVIAEVGGFWDIGDTTVNVPWNKVTVGADLEYVQVPVTEDSVDDYPLFEDRRLTAEAAGGKTGAVDDDVETGRRAFRATELIGDYVYLRDGRGYGYLDDVLFDKSGEITAVVVRPDRAYGRAGRYAYPWYGYGAGFAPGREYYQLPYTAEDVRGTEPVDVSSAD